MEYNEYNDLLFVLNRSLKEVKNLVMKTVLKVCIMIYNVLKGSSCQNPSFNTSNENIRFSRG